MNNPKPHTYPPRRPNTVEQDVEDDILTAIAILISFRAYDGKSSLGAMRPETRSLTLQIADMVGKGRRYRDAKESDFKGEDGL